MMSYMQMDSVFWTILDVFILWMEQCQRCNDAVSMWLQLKNHKLQVGLWRWHQCVFLPKLLVLVQRVGDWIAATCQLRTCCFVPLWCQHWDHQWRWLVLSCQVVMHKLPVHPWDVCSLSEGVCTIQRCSSPGHLSSMCRQSSPDVGSLWMNDLRHQLFPWWTWSCHGVWACRCYLSGTV